MLNKILSDRTVIRQRLNGWTVTNRSLQTLAIRCLKRSSPNASIEFWLADRTVSVRLASGNCAGEGFWMRSGFPLGDEKQGMEAMRIARRDATLYRGG